MKRKFKKSDAWLLGIVFVLVAGCLLYLAFRDKDPGDMVQITVDTKEYRTVPLNEDAWIEIETEEGTNVLVIEDGHAHMEEASCPDQVCIHQGEISLDGDMIVCLPNRVIIQIIGKSKNTKDALVQ